MTGFEKVKKCLGSGVTLGGFIQLHHEGQWYLAVETKDFLPTIAKFIQQTLFLSA